jgi:hypothetical protein
MLPRTCQATCRAFPSGSGPTASVGTTCCGRAGWRVLSAGPAGMPGRGGSAGAAFTNARPAASSTRRSPGPFLSRPRPGSPSGSWRSSWPPGHGRDLGAAAAAARGLRQLTDRPDLAAQESVRRWSGCMARGRSRRSRPTSAAKRRAGRPDRARECRSRPPYRAPVTKSPSLTLPNS